MRINILGYGTMGRQITALLRLLGYDITVWSRCSGDEFNKESDRALKLARRMLMLQEEVGTGEIEFTGELAMLEIGCTIEALVEDINIKKQVLGQITYDLNEIDFFTNTSSIPPPLIRPNAVGMHFFNPICVLKLIELTHDPYDLNPQGRQIIESLRNAGFEVVITSSNPGYIGNYVLFHEISATLKLVDRFGYEPDLIDIVMNKIRNSPSVFEIVDRIGLDTTEAIMLNIHHSDPAFYVSPTINSAIRAGILGMKNKTSLREFIHKRLSTSARK